MLSTLLITILLNPLSLCEGSATFQEKYRGSYKPDFIEGEHGHQIVAPDTPYVAAVGQNKLYFIDTRFDTETARHIKIQIERATVASSDEYIYIDEVSATAERRNSSTGETTFAFDPPYARVIFARGMNKRNPELNLPEHEPSGDWLVTYDHGTIFTRGGLFCYQYGCNNDNDCHADTHGLCRVCRHYRVDNECEEGSGVNGIGSGVRPYCNKAVDTAKKDGETDASYYQRMDKLHWA